MTRLDIRRVAARLLELAHDRRGVSAVEFALLLPLMLTLYITGTDLVSRVTTINTSGVKDSLNAATAVIAPYSTTKVTATVSQVYVDANGDAKIDWSCSYQGTAYTVGAPVTLPASLVVADSYLIWGETQYDYTPPIGYVISGTLHLKDQIYMAPRLSKNVAAPTSCPTFP